MKLETWQTKPQRAQKLPQFNSSTLVSCTFALLFTLSHIPHFFNFSQSKEDDVSELHFVWYMLCYFFFNNKDCNVVRYYFSWQFFLMIRNLNIMKVVVVPKQKKSQLDLYLEEPRLNKKEKFKVRSSLLVERVLHSVSKALFNGTGSYEHSDNHCCFWIKF